MNERLEDSAGELSTSFADQNRRFSAGFEGTVWSEEAIADQVETFQADLARRLEATSRPIVYVRIPTQACD